MLSKNPGPVFSGAVWQYRAIVYGSAFIKFKRQQEFSELSFPLATVERVAI
jgi:hypothetical protein